MVRGSVERMFTDLIQTTDPQSTDPSDNVWTCVDGADNMKDLARKMKKQAVTTMRYQGHDLVEVDYESDFSHVLDDIWEKGEEACMEVLMQE